VITATPAGRLMFHQPAVAVAVAVAERDIIA
jgi:hypothetical protein